MFLVNLLAWFYIYNSQVFHNIVCLAICWTTAFSEMIDCIIVFFFFFCPPLPVYIARQFEAKLWFRDNTMACHRGRRGKAFSLIRWCVHLYCDVSDSFVLKHQLYFAFLKCRPCWFLIVLCSCSLRCLRKKKKISLYCMIEKVSHYIVKHITLWNTW